MFNESRNPADHASHDPSLCDYARILLIQKYVAGTHEEDVAKLTSEQIVVIGVICALDSNNIESEHVYAEHNLTLEQVFEFSEYLRHMLMKQRGFLQSIPSQNPNLN